MSTQIPVYHTDHHLEKFDAQNLLLLLEFLLSHKIELVVELLRRQDQHIPRRITKDALRLRLEDLLSDGALGPSDLVQILNELEGWGRQQIYLYRFEGGSTARNNWIRRSWVENHFQQLNRQDILNTTRPIVTPDVPTLTSVAYTENPTRIRFIWVQKRTALERAEDEDPPPEKFAVASDAVLERIVYHVYRELTVRGIMSFDWDIESDEAFLTIRKLRGTKYSKVRDDMWSELQVFLPISDFHPLAISPVITRLQRSDEVVRRNLEFQTLNNEGRILVASGNQDDVFADEVLEQARAEIIGDVTGLGGNIRWKTMKNEFMVVELYCRVKDDQRLGIGAQELEEDIRHVLRRIRSYCT